MRLVRAGADGDGNGLIETADYNVWKAHFGQRLQIQAAATAAVFDQIGGSTIIAPHANEDFASSLTVPATRLDVEIARSQNALDIRGLATKSKVERHFIPRFNGRDIALLGWFSTRKETSVRRSATNDGVSANSHSSEEVSVQALDEVFGVPTPDLKSDVLRESRNRVLQSD